MIKFNNGYEIPKLGLGTFLMQDDNETKAVIKKALEVGYRHFDTAQMYRNEKAIGEALKESGYKREDIYITTKLARHHSKEETKALIMQSLKDLQTDYIDLLLIHWPNHDDKINLQTWQVFEELYEQGYLKAIGVSNFTRYQMEQLLKGAKIKPVVNQIELHPALSQVPTKSYLDNLDIRTTSYGPLMRGHMFDSPFIEVFEEIAKKHDATVAQVLIAWGLARGVMMIPKTVNEVRLVENFSASNVKLDESDILKINGLNAGRRYYTDPSNNPLGNLI